MLPPDSFIVADMFAQQGDELSEHVELLAESHVGNPRNRYAEFEIHDIRVVQLPVSASVAPFSVSGIERGVGNRPWQTISGI